MDAAASNLTKSQDKDDVDADVLHNAAMNIPALFFKEKEDMIKKREEISDYFKEENMDKDIMVNFLKKYTMEDNFSMMIV